MVHPPRAVSSVPALRNPEGRLVTAPAQLPRLVADYWSAVCRAPAVSPVARDAVLAAVRERTQPMTADLAAAVGNPQITAAEVAKALKATPSGKSPGWDGIPADLYRALRGRLAPVLADVFTAIGTSGRLPVGFLDGVITVLYKTRGDRTQAGSYRPITLLCTDYRLLTKVLATRLGPALATVVGLEQSAFLPGRLIGANILFLRHLPHLLGQQGRSCLVAFLDFAKAYDTLDRDFLFAVMDVLGPAGLVPPPALRYPVLRSGQWSSVTPRSVRSGGAAGVPVGSAAVPLRRTSPSQLAAALRGGASPGAGRRPGHCRPICG